LKIIIFKKPGFKKVLFVLCAGLALVLGIWANTLLKTDFTTLDDKNHTWSSLEGKWLVVNYFAEWCAPCLREIPELNHFNQQNKNDIFMFGVSFDPLDKQQLVAIQQKYNIQYPLIQKLNTLPWLQPPTSLPTTYIIGADGLVKKQLKGEQDAEKLLKIIHALQAL
jgi:thiol-disulfide isomerase/thioredoxin